MNEKLNCLEKSLFESKFEEKIETLEKVIVEMNKKQVKPINYDEVVNILQGLKDQLNNPPNT